MVWRIFGVWSRVINSEVNKMLVELSGVVGGGERGREKGMEQVASLGVKANFYRTLFFLYRYTYTPS